ncbi:MAG: leucine-rich repeat protein [Actinobacteria bacterium]|uniref:Unannotated protein n=1 Tax=freshwater metagenome TaxID=449393 RepID=A0A6J5ZQQ3_9ZZZZ|nr:leucine-rich repeat protein [Actinomycetota bacterium]
MHARRIAVFGTAVALALSGMISSAANAVVLDNGRYNCESGYYTITYGEVERGQTCRGSVTIPDGVVSIKSGAFANNTYLTSIVLPSSLTAIKSGAFYRATSLTNIIFKPGSNLELVIENNAFAWTSSLKSVTIPANADALRSTTFKYSGITNISFAPGSTVRAIEGDAFFGTQLASITIPASVEGIYGAFNNAINLSSITFTAGCKLIFIGGASFSGTPLLTDVNLAPCTNLESIQAEAFKNSGIDSIAIPAGVREIGNGAFFGASNLRSVFILGNPSLGFSVFSGTAAGAEIISAPTPPSLRGYIFSGWAETHGGSLVTFPFSPARSSAIVLYAKWSADPTFISAKKKYAVKSLAKTVGVRIVSSKAKVTFKVSNKSKKVCTKSGSKLKTLKSGNCSVTFTVQEPKPKKGKKPKAIKTAKTLVVQ